MSIYSIQKLQNDLAALTQEYQRGNAFSADSLSKTIDKRIGELYTKTQFKTDASRLGESLFAGQWEPGREQFNQIHHQYDQIAMARAMKFLNEKYLKGEFRYNSEDYKNLRYAPDFKQAPFVGYFPPSPQTWALRNVAWLSASELVQNHALYLGAGAVATYFYPVTTQVAAISYAGYQAYQMLGDA